MTWRAIRHLSSRAKHIFLHLFFDGSAVIRLVGAPARCSRAPSEWSAVLVAFVADGIEPSFNYHARRLFI